MGVETLVMQTDGNLVLRVSTPGNQNGPALWNSATWGNPGAYALMQADGNLVVYRKGGGPDSGGALWSTRSWNHPGFCAELDPYGDLTVTGNGGPAFYTHTGFWGHSGPADHPNDGVHIGNDSRKPGGMWLYRGNWASSRTTWLIVQQDGNVVLYRKSDNAVLWSSGTNGRGAWTQLVMQGHDTYANDGNLVIYYSDLNSPVRPLKSTGTYGNPNAYALLQDDGNFVVYRKDGTPLWSTGTYGRV